MASSSSDSSVNEHVEVPTSATILRDEDALSQALRCGLPIDVIDIARLDRRASSESEPQAASSTGGPSTAVASARSQPADMLPTSTSTHMIETHKGKGKARLMTGYASSVSAACGSASEAEREHRFVRQNHLLALGDWAHGDDSSSSRFLRGAARGRERQSHRRKPKQKKPRVDIGQSGRVRRLSEASLRSLVTTVPSYGTAATTRELSYISPTHDESLQVVEEGEFEASPPENPSKVAFHDHPYVMPGLMALKVIVITLSAYGAYLSGIAHLPSMKGIVFGAAVLSACLTILVMLLARRNVVEAMFAGFVEFAIGFALVAELDDFM